MTMIDEAMWSAETRLALGVDHARRGDPELVMVRQWIVDERRVTLLPPRECPWLAALLEEDA